MTRFKPLRDWDERLKRMSVDELRHERAYWQERMKYLGHPSARKDVFNRIRKIEKEIDSRD